MQHGLDAFMQFLKIFCLFIFFCKVVISTILIASVLLVAWGVVNTGVEFNIVVAVLIVSFFLSIAVVYAFTRNPLECFGDTTKSDERTFDVS